MLKRRRRTLGVSARPTRERTGVPHISLEAVGVPVGRIVRAFDHCGTSGLLKPATWRVTTEVRDAATGTRIPVWIQVKPQLVQHSPVTGQHELYVNDAGDRKDVVVLKPAADFCRTAAEWEIDLRQILTHELTHVVDSGLPKSKGDGSASLAKRDRCEYLRNKHEVTAFLAQMREELREFNMVGMLEKLRRKGFLKKPEDLLPRSVLWAELKRCLTPTQKKRFLRMAGMVWHELGFDHDPLYGARELGSVNWSKYAEADAWKDARGDVRVEAVQEAYEGGDGELKLQAKIGGRAVGEIALFALRGSKVVNVDGIAVGPRGQGVGTKLYEAAADWACRVARRPLASDATRTAASDAFWRKQVKKGRARCEKRVTGKEAAALREQEAAARPDQTIWARGGCERYVLTSCPATSLAGRRSR